MSATGPAGLSDDTTSYYDQIGGADAVREAVARFYARVTGDPELAHYFDSVDMHRLKRHQALLLGQVLGGPAAYDGRDLAVAHHGMGVTDDHFDSVAGHLVGTLADLDVPKHIIDFAAEAVLGLRHHVVTAGAE